MNTAIVSSIIGTVGAAFIAVLVFFLQALRDDIRAVGARIDKVESGLESRLGARIDKVESGLESRLGARIDKVESGLESRLGARIDKVESGLESRLGARFDKVESGLEARFDKADTHLGGIDVRLARIETTQEEHGRQLERIADHGERIAALEGAVAAAS